MATTNRGAPLFPVLRGAEESRKTVVTQHAQSPNSLPAVHKQNPVIKAAAVCFDCGKTGGRRGGGVIPTLEI